MLSKQLIEQIAQIGMLDINKFGESTLATNEVASYFGIERKEYFEILELLLNEADQMKLKNTTKFLAKKYQDQYLSKHPQFHQKDSPLVTITCLMTAIKFNQKKQASVMYSFEYWMERTQGQYSKDEFKKKEKQLLEVLNDKVSFVTPYDFLIVKPLLPHLAYANQFLAEVIDFSLTIPEFKPTSAESIFFGSLIYTCQAKKQPNMCLNQIKAMTQKWDESIWVARVLKKTLDKLLTQKQN